MIKGYVQVYTGDGKGKTTAALGLGLRAVGHGFKVIMFQFLKGAHSGELDSVALLGDKFKIIRLAETKKFFSAQNDQEKAELKERLQKEFKQVQAIISGNKCDLLILDEIMAALHAGLLEIDQVCTLIDSRPQGMELVLTGRSVPREILEKADLVTEMLVIKHYADKGVSARQGIEK
jgi:cob(I)alamin adenosyltransferase